MDSTVPELHPTYFIYLAAWIVTFCVCIVGARRYCFGDESTTRAGLDVRALQRIQNYHYNEERHESAESRQARNELVRKHLNIKQIMREESVVELIQVLASHLPNAEQNKNKADDENIQKSCEDSLTTADSEIRTLPSDEDVCIDIDNCESDDTCDAEKASESKAKTSSIDEENSISQVKNDTSPDPRISHESTSVSSHHMQPLPRDNILKDSQEFTANNNVACAICLQSFSPMDKIAWKKQDTLECFHIFHEGCLVSWLHWRDDCPLCRRVIVDADL